MDIPAASISSREGFFAILKFAIVSILSIPAGVSLNELFFVSVDKED